MTGAHYRDFAVEALGGKVYSKVVTVDLSEDVYLIDDVFCLEAACNTSISLPDFTDKSCCGCDASPQFATQKATYCDQTLPKWNTIRVGEQHHGFFADTDHPQYWRFYVSNPCKAYRFVLTSRCSPSSLFYPTSDPPRRVADFTAFIGSLTHSSL